MIDIYRFLLALTVVVFHSGFGGGGGVYALYGFYIISGYLIYRVCDQVYFKKDFKLTTFYVNRILRLIPHFIFSSFLIYITFFEI